MVPVVILSFYFLIYLKDYTLLNPIEYYKLYLLGREWCQCGSFEVHEGQCLNLPMATNKLRWVPFGGR